MSILWQDAWREIDIQEGRRSSERIHPREASLVDEVKTSLKIEGSTYEASDPRSKMESTRGSLGLSFVPLF